MGKSFVLFIHFPNMRVLEFCARFNKNAGVNKKLRLAHKKLNGVKTYRSGASAHKKESFYAATMDGKLAFYILS